MQALFVCERERGRDWREWEGKIGSCLKRIKPGGN